MSDADHRAALERIFAAGVAAARPAEAVAGALRGAASASLLIAVGKAAPEMARGAIAAGARPRGGLLIVRPGEELELLNLRTVVGGHPDPDAGSLRAGAAALRLAEDAREGDHLLVLLSGGASALMSLPPAGLGLAAKVDVARRLMQAGAPIEELNLVRRHLSRIKGGRLAAAAFPAATTTLALSDVVGDRPWDIGSGPTIGDPTSRQAASEVLLRRGIREPLPLEESIKPEDPRLARVRYEIIGSGALALSAAAEAAARAGYRPVILGGAFEGEARELGQAHARLALAEQEKGEALALLSGGELTVTVQGSGRGGPNLEYVAAAALVIADRPGLAVLSGDTDGFDGTSSACGAFAFSSSAARARLAGRPLEAALQLSATAEAFEAIGDLYRTGPTGTNVNDLRILLIEGR